MPRTGACSRIYTVVDVMRGVAVGAHSFRRLTDTRAFMRQLRDRRNLQEDDVQLFATSVSRASLKFREQPRS
jgi:hypothetical protein